MATPRHRFLTPLQVGCGSAVLVSRWAVQTTGLVEGCLEIHTGRGLISPDRGRLLAGGVCQNPFSGTGGGPGPFPLPSCHPAGCGCDELSVPLQVKFCPIYLFFYLFNILYYYFFGGVSRIRTQTAFQFPVTFLPGCWGCVSLLASQRDKTPDPRARTRVQTHRAVVPGDGVGLTKPQCVLLTIAVGGRTLTQLRSSRLR